MLDRLEKIQWTVSGLMVVNFVGMFFWPGLPRPAASVLPPMTSVDLRDFEKGLDKEQLKEYKRKINVASIEIKKAEKVAKPQQHDRRAIPMNVYHVARDKRLAVGQLNLVKGDPKTGRITALEPGSLLGGLDFRAGDTVELLDGKEIPYGDRSALWDLYDEKLAELEAGGSVVITVNRGGQHVHKSFRLEDLNRIRR